MYNLYGTYDKNTDHKGRLVIPARLRRRIEGIDGENPDIWIRVSPELPIAVFYPVGAYEEQQKSYLRRPEADPGRIAFFAFFDDMMGWDTQGRMNLGTGFADIEGFVVGNGDSMFFTTKENLGLLIGNESKPEGRYLLEDALRELKQAR